MADSGNAKDDPQFLSRFPLGIELLEPCFMDTTRDSIKLGYCLGYRFSSSGMFIRDAYDVKFTILNDRGSRMKTLVDSSQAPGRYYFPMLVAELISFGSELGLSLEADSQSETIWFKL
jgi:hypothetical protein